MTTRLLPDLADLGPWLVGRRWFRSRSRPLRAVTVHDRVPLPETHGTFLVLLVNFEDGGEERYLAPFVDTAEGPREAADGDGIWRSLVALMADGPRVVSGGRGDLLLDPGPALTELLPGGRAEAGGLSEEALGVEQSNSSVRLGDRLLLKLYRRLEAGINPEVEMLGFLTERGFAHAPLTAGFIRYAPDDGEEASAGILQSLVPARGDAWAWMLEHLSGPAAEPQQAIVATSRIGALTIALHETLQSADQPGFPSRLATPQEREGWRANADAELEAALAAAPEAERSRLAAVADRVRRAFAAVGTGPDARISRIHGDYHLGQLLVTDDGFVVTDFEGEPARPLADRRQPASPLRDVAGMLRSLDYAARTTQRAQPDFDADAWLEAARAALLTAYGELAHPALLRAFELEKACYEIRYEANFRPDWIWLPLEAIERMAA